MMRPRGGDPANGYVGGWAGFGLELLYARLSAAAWRRALAAPRVRPPVPVISIGNLAAGGSGKTPCAAWLARRLLERGRRVTLVARPVGGPVPGAEGDEIALLRSLVPRAGVVAARDKAAAALAAGRALDAAGPGGLVFVDDAFSHPRLERDLDLVLLDAARPLGNGHLLPYGPLREPPTALARAGAIVLTRADRLDAETLERTIQALAPLAPGVPVGAARLAPTGLVGADDGIAVGIEAGTPVVCLSGLARPHELAVSARALGARVVGERSYPDHHRFSDREWRAARDAARAHGARLVVSAKDAARLDPARRRETWVLEVEWTWVEGEERITRAIDAALERAGGEGR
jgi:tetraacyldisaccharide 4'-kinase